MALPARKAEALKKSRRGLEKELLDRTQDLAALYATFATLVSSDPAEVLQSAAERLKVATAADAALIRIVDPQSQAFIHVAHVGFSAASVRARRRLKHSADVNAALRSGEPMIVADIATDRRLKSKKQLAEGFRSCAFLPIMVAGKLRGLIHVVSRTRGHFGEAKKEQLTAIARQMGAALENRELFEKTQKLAAEIETRYGELQLLHELSQTVLSSPDIQSTLSAALKKVLASSRLDIGNIRLFDGSGRLQHSAYLGYSDESNTARHDANALSRGIFVSRVMASKQSVIVNDIGTVEGLRTFKREAVKSAIVIPIATDTETLGVIEVGSRTPRQFRSEEVRLLESMGAQIGVGVQKTRLFEQLRSSAQEQAALRSVATVASRSLETGEMLAQALEKVLEVTGRQRGSIRLKDPSTGNVELAAHRGFSPSEVDEIVQRHSHRTLEEVFATGKAVLINDAAFQSADEQLLAEARSVAWIPITAPQGVVGVLAVAGERPVPFERRETEFLENIGQVIGVALQNSRLYREAQRQEELQKLLKELSQDITSLDLAALFQKITDKVREFLKIDISDIRVLDEGDAQRLVGASGVDASRLYQMGGIQGRTTWMIEHRRPLVIPDTAKDKSIPTGRGLSRLGIRGYGAFPLLSRSGAVIGILRALSYDPRQFLPSEIDLLQQLANGAAIAIENARLFAETQSRQEEQAAINAIAMATTESLHVDELLKVALAKVLEVTGRKRGSIKLKDAATGKIVLAAHQGISEQYAQTIRSHFAPEERASEIFESGEVVVVNDPEKNIFNVSDREAGLRSLIWVPLKARGTVIGILNVSTPQTEPFTAREIELLKSIGHVIGIAVQNARLFEETERRGREQAALYAVTAAVGGSFDFDQTLAQALDTVLEVTAMDGGYIYLVGTDPGRIMLKAHRGMSESFIRRMEQAPAGGRTAQIVASKEPVIFENIPHDHEGRFKGESVTAAAWVPILSKNIVVGMLVVCTKNRPTFPHVQLPLLVSIGNALGVALENTRLFRETERHLKRLQALREIDQAISSTLDLDNVLKILLEKIDITLPYASATIRLVNRQNGLLEPVACRNLDEAEWKKEQAGRGIPNAVFATKAPVVIRDVRSDARALDLEFYRKHHLISYVGVPLVVEEEIIGVLGFYTKEEHEFETEEINFLATLAGQAAIAIQNSQLYEEARLRETQLEDSNRMLSALHAAAAAASQSLHLSRVLHAVIEKITETFGFRTTQVHIYDPRSDELVLGGYFDIDAETSVSVRSFRPGHGIVGTVAATGKPMIFEDIQTDPAYRRLSRNQVAGGLGHHFFAVFPIRGKLKNLGTLACTGIDPRRLTSGEVKLLESLTDQLAVAIENSQLYDELKQKVEELERANRVKDEFLSVMSHELRTPLNVVIGYAGLIREGMLGATNPEQDKALDKLVSRTNDLLSMITSILYAASIEANEVRIENDHFALGEFLDDLKRSYLAPLGKPVELEWSYAPDLPVVFSDRDKVKCILQHLIGNAVKFTDNGRVAVTATVAPTERRREKQNGKAGDVGAWMEFKVSDNGIGIAPEKLPLIFDKFRQADSSETRQYGGVGLGLYIAKSFTEMLGGKLSLETEPGKGSVFSVKLPCRDAPDLTTIEVRAPDPKQRTNQWPPRNDSWVKQ